MRIVFHDYSGHAFILEFARALARKGHTVLHLYSGSFLTPQGNVDSHAGDPETFTSKPIALKEKVHKDSFFKRWKQDKEHGLAAAREVAEFRPDYVVCSNTPLEAMKPIQKAAREVGAKFVFWCQDINGIAIKAIVGERLPLLGGLIGDYFIRMEAKLLRDSDIVIVISEDFKQVFKTMGVNHPNVHVLPNWGPLDQIPALPRQNVWSKQHGLDDSFVFLYSGTLGFKHNPSLLIRLAESFASNPSVVVQVVSEGKAVEWLRTEAASKNLTQIRTLPFQPFSEVPSVFASADVLLAILEPSASEFSVPSKVLAYLCARRPLLLSVLPANLVARTVADVGAGFVVPPDDEEGFVKRAHELYQDEKLRATQADAGRSYAEKTFDLDAVEQTFLGFLAD